MTHGKLPDYQTAAKKLVISFTERSTVDPRDLQVVQSELDRVLGRRFRGMDHADRADAIADTMTSLLVAARRGGIDPEGKPGTYIRRATENRALSQLRRTRDASLDVTGEGLAREVDDDAIAAYLDAQASAQEVEETMALLASQGKDRVNLVVGEWLVLAEQLEREPSTREAGEAMGISHDTVARYLQVFREALLEVRSYRQLL